MAPLSCIVFYRICTLSSPCSLTFPFPLPLALANAASLHALRSGAPILNWPGAID